MAEADDHLRELVAEVAASYFSNSHTNANDIPTVISQIASSLSAVRGGGDGGQQQAEEAPKPTRMTPAQVRKSVTPDALISFEDNKPYKTLRRHLAGRGLTPQQYREKHGLPNDYPMTSPNYSAMRSQMAKSLGLGQKGAQGRANRKSGGDTGGASSGGGRGRKAGGNS